MSILMSAFSLFVSLIALWLIAESNKRAGNSNSAFIKAHIKGLKDEIAEIKAANEKAAKVLYSRIQKLEDEVQISSAAHDAAINTLDSLLRVNREKQAVQDSRHTASERKVSAA